jgi:hypothetical protein
MSTAEKGLAHPAADQSRRPNRGKRAAQGDADEYHGRGAKTVGGPVQSSRLPRDGRVHGSAGIDFAADAATATAAGHAYATNECCAAGAVDGDAVRATLVCYRGIAEQSGFTGSMSFSFLSCRSLSVPTCMGEKGRPGQSEVDVQLLPSFYNFSLYP